MKLTKELEFQIKNCEEFGHSDIYLSLDYAKELLKIIHEYFDNSPFTDDEIRKMDFNIAYDNEVGQWCMMKKSAVSESIYIWYFGFEKPIKINMNGLKEHRFYRKEVQE